MKVKAVVRNGRLETEPAVLLPEGAEFSLVSVDEDDDLDEAERARLDAALERAEAALARGEGVDEAEAPRQLFGPRA